MDVITTYLIDTVIGKLGTNLFQSQIIVSVLLGFLYYSCSAPRSLALAVTQCNVCKQRARAARPWPNVKNCLTASWWRNNVEQFTEAISCWQRFVCVLSADETNDRSPCVPTSFRPGSLFTPFHPNHQPNHKLPRSLQSINFVLLTRDFFYKIAD